ncbi:hypothetical protein CGRA01v4_14390 [Colletotrichum graminicola]|uniref:2EXR domain-containing protein n=1 Tax=Colletotrichum graminicola (strain M1.001 / M2 / FGSC 10212) TaxID=645133 RepID=E3Q5L0_COLGM|nr:uncharacterized protein GLRG_01121 [Colletotrichum graminicola M1.001]EFQ25977.1 hypothetical protein GLRG_01121 [Colletotrichum graminicola M1.001]WDK23099.1 hypothetical protein CGRA01v4_14390 [Colletotrichum graminicola]
MSDSSDESGPEGAGLVQNDASDSESSGSDSGAENGNGTGFLDVEASESLGGDSDDSSDSDSEDESILGEGRRRAPRVFFPEFRRLPIELRHRIWQFFCPDLALFPRVLSFQVVCSPKQDSIWESATLENQIAAASAMLAVHHESRELALKAFPDTLAIREGRRLVRFHKHRDVVHLNNHKKNWRHNMNVPGFSENVVNLAMDTDLNPWEMRLLLAFPNLKNVFDFTWHNDRRIPHRMGWCASDRIHRYEIEQLRKNVHTGEDLHFVYCWPDVDNHRDFAQEKVGMTERFEAAMTEVEEIREERSDFMEDEEVARLGEIDYWQMMCFGWDAADRFEAFVAKHGAADGDMPAADDSGDDEHSGTEESDGSSDQNEYESEGIDDATIDGESSDEDEDDLVIDTRQASDDEDDEGGASDFGGFSPPRDEDGGMMVDGSGAAAHFSGPEPESGDDRPRPGGRRARQAVSSDEEDDDDDDEEEPGEGKVEAPSRGASRRSAVILSDEEEEEQEDDDGAPSRSTGRRGPVVLSDDEGDEDEAAKPARPSGRRARVLPSDDEDEDEDEGGVDVHAKGGSDDGGERAGAGDKPLSLAEKLARNRRDNPVSDEEEDEEDEPAPPEKMSLAQRLMTHRKRNPIESESETDGGSEGSVVDSEDDMDDEDESEEEEDGENGMFMNMADDGESDDEGDEEEY